MFDLILILGITLSTAGLVGAPCRHRPRPCREEDTRISPRAGLLLQKDTLSTAIPFCLSCAQEHKEREDQDAISRDTAVTAREQPLRSEPGQETRR